MTRSGPPQVPNGTRRLPKVPTVVATGDLPPSERGDQQARRIADSSLYFEDLPEPSLRDRLQVKVTGHTLLSEREILEAPGIAPSVSLKQSSARAFLEQSEPAQEPVAVRPEAVGRLQSALARASAQHVVPEGKRSSGARSASTATARTSGHIATSPDLLEDPKPASARSSGATRSRPSRPSVGVAAAQRSNEVFPGVPATPLPPALMAVRLQERELPEANASLATPAQESFVAADGRPEDEPVAIAASTRPAAKTALPSASRVNAVVGMVAASVLLVLYAFEIGTLESSANAAAAHLMYGGAGSTATQTFASVLPWLLILPALALFGFIVWLLAGIIGVRRINKSKSRVLRSKLPLNQFKAAADRHGIENRTAYRTWRLLEATCAPDREIRVESSLSVDLALTDKEVRTIHLALLSELSRVSDPTLRLPPTETVLDLMLAAEDAPLVRTGGVVIPGDPGGPRRRN